MGRKKEKRRRRADVSSFFLMPKFFRKQILSFVPNKLQKFLVDLYI
jgi:hypothetical protein